MKHFLKITLVLVALITITGAITNIALAGRTEGIAAVVNDDAISLSDVNDRMRLVMSSSALPDKEEIRSKLQPQVIGALIDERLMIQESARLEIAITTEDIDRGVGAIAGQNNFSADQFKNMLRGQKIPIKTLQDQIASQIAWSRVVQVKLRPKIEITEYEIDTKLQRLAAAAGKRRYLVSEIFLPINKPADEDNVRQLADRLTQQLTTGRVPFQRLASQFSQAAGASKGGDLGWVQEGQLPEELDNMLGRMNEGELGKPVRSLTGFHILYLRKKDIMSDESLPSRDEVSNALGMERLDRMQRRLLLDLKAAAFIENRV